jgi:dephospho-CoA kinase
MLKIGLTGGIGSGKTTIAHIFEILDIPVYYADTRAKQIVNENQSVKKKILQTFGNVYSNGKLKRADVAKIVFNKPELLQKLNSIVHPAVAEDFEIWCDKNSDSKYIIEEAAILFESGAHKRMDKNITVFAPENIRIKRVCNRDNISAKMVMDRIKNQLPDEKKMLLADFVINNFGQNALIPQVIDIHNQIIKICS